MAKLFHPKVNKSMRRFIFTLFYLFSFGIGWAQSESDEMAVLYDDRNTCMSNGGWNLDRYDELQSLEAGKSIVIADIEGPGIIRHIHTTRHHPAELFARGIVLEIRFDNASEPAVEVPLADFFGDGCNGRSTFFSSNLIECAPWSYNCYIPMPFKERAVVILRNETTQSTDNYSYVEWETIPKWNKHFAYFHATYRRDGFQLTPDTNYEMIHIEGRGHLVGRQLSVSTDEPLWGRAFNYVMEGNNEVDIDDQERVFDYLGTEDSFTFSWGFQHPFTGPHAGMPLIYTRDTSLLSIYRFHDHMPIRFRHSLTWRINWSEERHFTNRNPRPQDREWAEFRAIEWAKALAREGCWVDYASVFYWYQDTPGGFEHLPLPPLAERQKTLLKSNL